MGVYIKDMEKPTECGHCDMFIEHNSIYHCYLTGSHITFIGEVADDCPLIEIGDIEYQAYKEFRTMLLKKIEERIIYGEIGG